MDLEDGTHVYVEARADQRIELMVSTDDDWRGIGNSWLTTEEARTLAQALLAAAEETDLYRSPLNEGAMSGKG